MSALLTLTAECVLPECANVVTLDGEPCRECVRVWGPYLHEKGTVDPWAPTMVPACGHGWWWWDRHKDRCRHYTSGCTRSDLVPNNRIPPHQRDTQSTGSDVAQ